MYHSILNNYLESPTNPQKSNIIITIPVIVTSLAIIIAFFIALAVIAIAIVVARRKTGTPDIHIRV